MVIANSALRASLAIYHLISKARSWNNCQLLSDIIIWLCLTRTENYKIHEFDWLKSILTTV